MNAINVICLLLFVVYTSAKYFAQDEFTSEKNQLRIINGEDATLGQFPHQVSLRSYISKDHYCGGSILNSKYILTAAHCAQGRNAIPLFIYTVVGTIDRKVGGTRYRVSRVYNHPKYNPNRLLNDIALLRTKNEILFNEYVQPIALPTADLAEEGNVVVTISGWGRIKYPPPMGSNGLPITLQFLNARTLSYENCKKGFANVPDVAALVDKTMVCTTNPGSGTCHGDSGSPLITEDKVVIGIADWVIPCAKNYPDGYTKVYPFLDFIHGVMNIESDDSNLTL